MRVTINRAGCLVITPDSELDLYALRKWMEGYNVIPEGVCDSTMSVNLDETPFIGALGYLRQAKGD